MTAVRLQCGDGVDWKLKATTRLQWRSSRVGPSAGAMSQNCRLVVLCRCLAVLMSRCRQRHEALGASSSPRLGTASIPCVCGPCGAAKGRELYLLSWPTRQPTRLGALSPCSYGTCVRACVRARTQVREAVGQVSESARNLCGALERDGEVGRTSWKPSNSKDCRRTEQTGRGSSRAGVFCRVLLGCSETPRCCPLVPHTHARTLMRPSPSLARLMG